MKEFEDKNHLHFGDLISLFTENKVTGFISTVSLVDTRCVAIDYKQIDVKQQEKNNLDLRDCIFKVMPQLKYSAQKQCKKSLSQKNKIIDEATLAKLQHAAEQEKESNEHELSVTLNCKVNYGDVVQLLHLRSNRYLTVDKFSANVEKTALKVYLNAFGDEGSWFQIQPYYKLRSIGQNILVGDRIVLQSVLGLMPLHASDLSISSDRSNVKEINCRLLIDSNPIEAIKFSQSATLNNSIVIHTSWKVNLFLTFTEISNEFLKSGDVIQLFHVEQESYVSYHNDKNPNVSRAWSTNALWEVEIITNDLFRGSIAKWNSLFRFKNLLTGLYLAFDSITNSFLTYSNICNDLAIFELDSTENIKQTYEPILRNSFARLKHWKTKSWLRFENIKPEMLDRQEQQSIDDAMFKISCSQTKIDNEAFKLIYITSDDIRNLDFICDISNLLKELRIKLDEKKFDFLLDKSALESILIDLIKFLTEIQFDSLKINKSNTIEPLKLEIKNPNNVRQELIREELILDEIFHLLYLFENNVNLFNYVIKLCFKTIQLSQINNIRNQDFISKYFKLMQSYIGYDVFAEEILINLFHSNRELLKLMITYDEINLFVSSRKLNQDQKYLKYLTDLCVVYQTDEVISDVQDYVCKSILKNESNSSLIILTE